MGYRLNELIDTRSFACSFTLCSSYCASITGCPVIEVIQLHLFTVGPSQPFATQAYMELPPTNSLPRSTSADNLSPVTLSARNTRPRPPIATSCTLVPSLGARDPSSPSPNPRYSPPACIFRNTPGPLACSELLSPLISQPAHRSADLTASPSLQHRESSCAAILRAPPHVSL